MPVLIIAAAMAAAQAYQSEKARGAQQAQLDAMKADFDKLIPPGMNISITDPPQMIQTRVKDPQFSNEALTPEQFKVAAQYQPQIAQQVAEKNPELIKQSAAATEGRQAQIDALRQMRGIASSNFDPQLQEQLQSAARKAQGDAQSRNASIMQDMQRRGAANSGIAAAMQQNASADAMDREAQIGQSAAAQGYQNRISAMRNAAQMGGDINSSETSLAARNADIINGFNQRMAANGQAWQNNRTNTINDANRYNTGVAQGIADRNTSQNNQYAVNERDRQDRLEQSRYGRDVDERNYQNSLAQQRSNWQEQQRQYVNQMRQQQFGNQLAITQGRNGLASQQMGMDRQNAQDRNSMIQGAGQAGMGYYQNQQDQSRWNDQQDREDARWQMRYGKTPKDDEENAGDYGNYSNYG